MAENTKIEWANHTLNFWWGCQKVSTGCKHCYAETQARWRGKQIWGSPQNSQRHRTKTPWKDVFKWNKKAEGLEQRPRVFVNSMSDFFEDHPNVNQWRKEAIEILESLTNLDFMILTKRPENMECFTPHWVEECPDNIWLGTSVENQQQANLRIPHLLRANCKRRFLSCEPLLEQVLLFKWLTNNSYFKAQNWTSEKVVNYKHGDFGRVLVTESGWELGDQTDIHLVIVGGESGQKARPFDFFWAKVIKDECEAYNVPFFMKQGGQRGNPNFRNLQTFEESLQVRQMPKSVRSKPKWFEVLGVDKKADRLTCLAAYREKSMDLLLEMRGMEEQLKTAGIDEYNTIKAKLEKKEEQQQALLDAYVYINQKLTRDHL